VLVDFFLTGFYTEMMKLDLQARQSTGSALDRLSEGSWRLAIPAGPAGAYRWAQLDDYMHSPRSRFPWRASVRLELRARISSARLPGTWGFGFWNDPFNASLGVGGTARRLPALPNAAWFFYAGQPNHLAFRDDHPASGFLAAAFSSPLIPSFALAPAALAFPLLAVPPAARWLRRAARLIIDEDAALVPGDPAQWHAYRLDLGKEQVSFFVDGKEIFSSRVVPRGKLGLVIWLDNQFAAFPPSGRLRTGTSLNPEPAWLDVDQIEMAD
jgi:hypothetical protein